MFLVAIIPNYSYLPLISSIIHTHKPCCERMFQLRLLKYGFLTNVPECRQKIFTPSYHLLHADKLSINRKDITTCWQFVHQQEGHQDILAICASTGRTSGHSSNLSINRKDMKIMTIFISSMEKSILKVLYKLRKKSHYRFFGSLLLAQQFLHQTSLYFLFESRL